jgi:hypothetical protein
VSATPSKFFSGRMRHKCYKTKINKASKLNNIFLYFRNKKLLKLLVQVWQV